MYWASKYWIHCLDESAKSPCKHKYTSSNNPTQHTACQMQTNPHRNSRAETCQANLLCPDPPCM